MEGCSNVCHRNMRNDQLVPLVSWERGIFPGVNPVASVSHIISWNKWERECCSPALAFREF